MNKGVLVICFVPHTHCDVCQIAREAKEFGGCCCGRVPQKHSLIKAVLGMYSTSKVEACGDADCGNGEEL